MAELRRVFSAGRMNKDIDERLLHPGEYRDALNVGVGNSESSDVGAVENIRGNQRIPLVANVISTEVIPGMGGSRISSFTGAVEANETVTQSTTLVVNTLAISNPAIPMVGQAVGVGPGTGLPFDAPEITSVSAPGTPNSIGQVPYTIEFNQPVDANVGDPVRLYTTTTSGGTPDITIETSEEVQLTLDGAITLGSIRYDLEEKIYWFVKADQGDYIFEYDQTTNQVAPILADTTGVLEFSEEYLITGINVLGGQLYWTDGNVEPKKINIERFKTATNGLLQHTEIYGRPFIEQDILVIKKSPLRAPKAEGFQALMGTGNYDGTVTATFTIEDVDSATMIPTPAGDSVMFTVIGANLAYRVGEQIRLFSPAPLEEDAVEIIATITNISTNLFTATINTISDNVPLTEPTTYDISLFDSEVLFELKFPRFAYRWKYIDGEYSGYSPFSEAVFTPGEYQYNAEEGFNVAMTNTIRRVIINEFDQAPPDVVEVDLLYKESNTTAVYTVETIPVTMTEVEILRDQIHAILPENQLLRPYDNVPRTAKAQDVVANRLVYGNYTHNYDVNSEPAFTVEANAYDGEANRSIKSLRDYQFGVVYQDMYGRQTPVLSHTSGSINIPVAEAPNTNEFCVTLNNDWPNERFTDYRYYIKETSNEYYNLALDRYYTGDDGFVWLSFPSSEFNKVTSEDYIYLKKGHTTSTPVTAADARYKVLDVQTEAPDFIKRRIDVRGSIPYAIGDDPFNTLPEENAITFDAVVDGTNSLYPLLSTGSFVRFTDGTQRSQQYKITSASEVPLSDGRIQLAINVDSLFGEDIVFVTDPNTPGEVAPVVSLEIAEEVVEALPEFIGRFFVKIILNGTFRDNVITPSTEERIPVYGVVEEQQTIYNQLPNSGPGDSFHGMFWDFRNRMVSHRGGTIHRVSDGQGIQQGSNTIHISQTGISPYDYYGSNNRFQDYLGKTGTFIRFTTVERVDGVTTQTGLASETVYEIRGINHQGGYNGQDPCGTVELQCNSQTGHGNQNTDGWLAKYTGNSSGWFKRWEIQLDKPLDFDPGLGFETGAHDRAYADRRDDQVVIGIEILQDLSEIGRNAEGGSPYTSDPAIFETEPRGDSLLDVYYETQETFSRAQHGEPNKLKWYNCFSFGNGVESNRIRDDFNGVLLDKGPRVSTTIAEQFREEHRPSGLIWSGIFNTTTGINNTNQFILAEGIQKELQPLFGSIQKLHSRDTNMVTFCEDKVVRILADKDALYNADGSTNLNSSNAVLGQTTPFTGEYGISKNPESFATYGSRIYFTDKNRGVALRLSQDGLTEISQAGVEDFIRDRMRRQTGPIIGSYDDYHDKYILTFNTYSMAYDEHTKGWPSRYSFVPESGLSLNNTYYTFKNGDIYEHNSTAVGRNNFYGNQYQSSIVFIFNDAPESVKNFKTLNYEGTQPKTVIRYDENDDPQCLNTVEGGWFCPMLITDQQAGDARAFLNKEGKWFTNLGVLGGAEAISAVNDTFDNIDDEDGGGDGPLLEDDEIFDDLMDDGSDGDGLDGDDPFEDGLDDGEIIGDGDGVEETDDDGNPLPDQNQDIDTTIRITLE